MGKIDKFNMYRVILDFPKQFRLGLEAAKDVKVQGKFDAVLICGMGGSALPGDVLDMWLKAYRIELPLFINRNYHLPDVDENCLLVCISHSGNTEETLYNYKEALEKQLKVVVITSGGRLGELCKENKTPAAIVPSGIPPRLALGYQFSALMKILSNTGIIQNEFKDILAIEKKVRPKKIEEQSKKLAKNLKGKIPIIYAAKNQETMARIWKTNFCETAKILALHNSFPELCHNEIVGFWKINKMQLPSSKLHLIILRDKTVHPRILKQMEIVKDLIEKEKVKVEFIEIRGKDILEKIFSNLILGFWVSYHLALLYNVDPTPIKITEEFKKRLSQKN